MFGTTVTSTTWDDAAQALEWSRTDRGDEMRARFVICANGTLSKPKLSKIAGMERFRGQVVPLLALGLRLHRRRPLEKLSDKVVGIIGTGASAVPMMPKELIGPLKKKNNACVVVVPARGVERLARESAPCRRSWKAWAFGQRAIGADDETRTRARRRGPWRTTQRSERRQVQERRGHRRAEHRQLIEVVAAGDGLAVGEDLRPLGIETARARRSSRPAAAG